MNYNAFFPGKLLTWLMLTNQEAWIGDNIFCFPVVWLGMVGIGWDGMDGSPGWVKYRVASVLVIEHNNYHTRSLLLRKRRTIMKVQPCREELVAWLDLCGAEINVSKITGLLTSKCWILTNIKPMRIIKSGTLSPKK